MDKKQIPILLAVLGIAAAALVYVLYFQPTMENVERLKSEDVQLQARISELEALRDQRDFFIEETEKMSEKVSEIYDQFPANVMAEDAIREGIDIEDGSLVMNTAVDYPEPQSVYYPIGVSVEEMKMSNSEMDAAAEAAASDAPASDDVEGEAPAPDGEEEETGAYELVAQPVVYMFEGDLDGFLKAALTVNKKEERDVIELASLVYDESTGLLECEMDVGKYYLTGRADKEYAPASFSVPTGTNTLFSTVRTGTGTPTSEGGGSSEGGGEGGAAAPPAD